jgi:hypothetical protein
MALTLFQNFRLSCFKFFEPAAYAPTFFVLYWYRIQITKYLNPKHGSFIFKGTTKENIPGTVF